MSASIPLDLELGQFGTPFPINFYINGPLGQPIDTNFAINEIGQSITIIPDFKLNSPVNVWRCFIGEQDSFFEIPVSSLKIQKNYDRPSIITAEVPAANQYITQIDAARDQYLSVKGGVITDGVEQLRGIVLAPIDEISYSYRPEQVTCSIQSSTSIFTLNTGAIWYVDNGVFEINIVDGELESYSGTPRYQVNPGDLIGVNVGGLSYTFIAGTITYTIGPALARMQVSRLQTQASVATAETAIAGPSEEQPPAGTASYTIPKKTTAEMSGWTFSISGGSGQVVQGPRSTRLTF